jgi:uncharacterized membrane protein
MSLYASTVIVKDKRGKVSVKQKVGYGPADAALGLLIDSLVGVLGGPTGVAVGASLSFTGLLLHLEKVGVAATFVDDVSKTLTAGKAAVLAEVEESWTSLVDEPLQKHGGTVFRRFRVDVVEEQLVRKQAALEAHLKELQRALKRAVARDKEAIKKDVKDVKYVKKQIKDTLQCGGP